MLALFRKFTLLPAIVLAAVAPALADVQLGRFTCTSTTSAARSLKTTAPLARSLGSAPRLRFVGKVGGVGFDAVAVAAEGFKVESLAIAYDPTREDGERLVLEINGEEVAVDLPDWQLIPIARYAASDSTSCFTLFGELEDKQEEEALKADGHRILNYDDAFRDTLLGLRLFQLDVLLLDDDFALELPKDGEGNYLIGLGESEPDLEEAVDALSDYRTLRNALEIEGELDGFDTDHQSWVITDHGVNVVFGVEDGFLEIAGEPFFYFWNQDLGVLIGEEEKAFAEAMRMRGMAAVGESYDDIQSRILEQRREFQAKVDEAFEKLTRSRGVIKQDETVADLEDRLEAEREKFGERLDEALFEIGKAEGVTKPDDTAEDFAFRIRLGLNAMELEGEERKAAEARNASFLKMARERVKAADPEFKDLSGTVDELYTEAEMQLNEEKKKLDEVDAAEEAAEEEAREAMLAYQDSEDAVGVYLDRYSQRHVTLSKKLAEVNPEVWNAGRATLQFGAFFRYLRDQHPAAWQGFLKQIETNGNLAEAQPPIETPAVLRIPN